MTASPRLALAVLGLFPALVAAQDPPPAARVKELMEKHEAAEP